MTCKQTCCDLCTGGNQKINGFLDMADASGEVIACLEEVDVLFEVVHSGGGIAAGDWNGRVIYCSGGSSE
jgi:hypothetical protein